MRSVEEIASVSNNQNHKDEFSLIINKKHQISRGVSFFNTIY